MAHSLLEDAYALLSGTFLVTIGLLLMKAAGIVTAGVVGLALLVSYLVPLGVGLLFFLINVPFFALGLWKLGRWFMIRTILACALVYAFTALATGSLDIASVHPAFAALGGGTCCGTGILALMRHRTGVGGVNILAMWAQEARGWNVGRLQLVLDGTIILAALGVLPMEQFGWSVLSVIATNMVLVAFHRPGRYLGY